MKLASSEVILTLALVSAVLPIYAEAQFALRDGDRVAFYGDEITAVQFYDNALEPRIYPTFVEAYVATRYPIWKINFVDSAWNGDRVNGGAGGAIDVRLERDVIAHRPTVLTIMLGMNDARTAAFNPKDHEAYTTGYDMAIDPRAATFDAERFATFKSGYEHLLDRLRQALPEVRITLLKPSPYFDVSHLPEAGDFNRVLLRYGEALDSMAQREHLAIADPNVALTNAVRAAYLGDRSVARDIVPDGIHPAAAGHLVIAQALLKAWNAPALVSEVDLDASRGQVVHAENTVVHALKAGKTLTWTQTDASLPFPLDLSDPAVALVVRTSDFVQALDQEKLKVDGLSAARYELRIDGEAVGTFAVEQLRGGINLALLDTPMTKQAVGVFHLVQQREDVHFGMWKRLEFPSRDVSLPHKQQAAETMAALEQDLREEQHSAAQPRPHRYELRPMESSLSALRLP